jgi:ABC-2 type transport system ATP-binding protein
MAAIVCEQLTKTYRRTSAVHELNLRVEVGQVYGFLGANGAGKTTTIRLMLGLVKPSAGQVRLFGKTIQHGYATGLERVGAMVEGASFYPYLSAWENLRIFGLTRGEFQAQHAQNLLAQLGLAERAQDKVRTYSLGMKQRLGIVAALLHQPDLLILDEPTNGLDPAGMHELRVFLRRLADEEGKTIFLSSHLLGEVQQICDRVAIMHKGRLLAEGRVEDLLAQQNAQARLVALEVQPLDKALVLLSEYQPQVGQTPPTLRLQAPHSAIPELVRRLVMEGVAVYEVTSQQASLEEFFLTITQGEAR